MVHPIVVVCHTIWPVRFSFTLLSNQKQEPANCAYLNSRLANQTKPVFDPTDAIMMFSAKVCLHYFFYHQYLIHYVLIFSEIWLKVIWYDNWCNGSAFYIWERFVSSWSNCYSNCVNVSNTKSFHSKIQRVEAKENGGWGGQAERQDTHTPLRHKCREKMIFPPHLATELSRCSDLWFNLPTSRC